MWALVSVVSLFVLGIQATSEWSYSGDDGLAENQWPEKYPSCGGKRQSPIDVKRRKVPFNRSLLPLHLVNYNEELELSMTNNGHTVQLSLPDTIYMIDSDGTEYVAKQMHFHWGGRNSEISGSEHTIDGMRSMMEIHLVHFNKKYGTYENAKDKEDGLAVIGVLVKVDDYAENTYYSTFISELAKVKYPGQTTTLKNFNVRDMLPVDIRHYYTYQGSLTTPPCTENVKWFVFRDTVALSKVQAVNIENSVLDHKNKTIQNGYRGTQPLYNRVVEANFPYFPDKDFEDRSYIKHKKKSPRRPKKEEIYLY